MRKFFIMYFPASFLLVFLAMVLLTCGGGGGGGSSQPQADLTGLSVNGPPSMSEYGTAVYTATASWSDNSTSTVTPTWSVNSQVASISPGGVLSCPTIDNDQTVTVTATYSSGGITEADTMDVMINNIATIPFTAQMLSGGVFFEENLAGGGYESTLSLLNADFSFEQYSYKIPPDTSDQSTGTWSIDASGDLIVNISGQGTVTVRLLADLFTEFQVLVDDGTGTPETVILEKSGPGPYPFDDSLLPGTYVNQLGDIWIFNADGTGSTTGDGGWIYTWSVDSGILRVVFPLNGYVGSMYLRPGSQSTATEYTIIDWAFVIHDPAGGFGAYYGGMELTRQ